MNTDLLRKVADAIEASPTTFDMDHWEAKTSCGTVHCIGGWGAALSGVPMKPSTAYTVFTLLRDLFELSNSEANSLFFADSLFWDDLLWLIDTDISDDGMQYTYLTGNPEWVASVLRDIADGTITLPNE